MDTTDLDRAGEKVDRFTSRLGKSLPAPNVDWSGFESRLRRNADDFEKFGRKATIGVTLPLVAAGAASVKLANDFDSTFQRMISLAGVTADEVDGLKESVKALASETGKSPQDLAEGLEVIRSAGITGAQALEVLSVSAKASAIGLGTTREVADAVTSALNAYGPATLNAAQATDILAGSVQAAKVEAAEMAPQFGRLLPLASTLGVSFDQVGGALAYLTRGSGDASLASAQLGGILQKVLNPSKQARDILASVGLTVDGLQKSIREDGLIVTLQLLNDKLGGNQQALARFFEDAQGIQGVFSLLTNGGKDAAKVIEDVGNSTGQVSGAFAAFSDTDAAKMQKSLAELQTAMIELGSSLAPTVSKIAGGVADIATAFSSLPGPVQVALLAVVAAFGPVASIIGKVGNNIDTLKSVAARGAGALRTLGGEGSAAAGIAGGALALGIGAATVAIYEMERASKAAENAAKALREESARTGETLAQTLTAQLSELAAGVGNALTEQLGSSGDQISKTLKAAGVSVTELADGLSGSDAQFKAFAQGINESFASDPRAAGLLDDLQILRSAYVRAGTQTKDLAANNKQLGIATDEAATSTGNLTAEQQANIDAALGQGEATETVVQSLLKAIDAADAYASAQRDAEDAIAAVAENERAAAGQSEEAARLRAEAAKQAKRDAQAIVDATDAVVDAEKGVQDAVEARAQAVADAADAQKRVNELEADSLQLKKDLADATATYTDRLNEQKNAARSDALSVEEALARVQDAQDALSNSEGDDFETTKNEQRLLEIDLIRAQDALDAAKKKAEQAKQDAAAAELAGPAGDPVVQAAQDAVDQNAQAIDDAKGQVVDAQRQVAEADQRVVDAHKAVGRAAQDLADTESEAADRRAETAARIKKLQDDAITKSGELKQAAKDAIEQVAAQADALNVPIDVIAAGIEKLKTKSVPELQALLVPLLEGLNTAVNTSAPSGLSAGLSALPGAVSTGQVLAGPGTKAGFTASRIASPITRTPSLVGVGGGGGLPPVVVNLTVGGELGAAQKMELHRIASDAVSAGIAKSAGARGTR